MNAATHEVFICNAMYLVFLICSNCANTDTSLTSKPHNPLIGTWELEKVEFVFEDTTIVWDNTMFHSTYFVEESHFNFIYSNVERDSLLFAGYGSYTMADNKYIEHIEFHSLKYIIGTSVIFDNIIDGDTWIHEGYLPTREEDLIFFNLAQGSPTIHMIETRKRVK